jgi:hypothetical protein
MIELLTLVWLFNTSQPAQSTLTAQAPQAEFAAPANATDSFTVKFTVDLKTFDGEKTILEIPNALSVRLRQHDPHDRNRQNYPAFKMPDGSVPVLEANVVLHSREHPDWKNMTVGIPLALLKKPEGEHQIVLDFSGVRWTMYVDGELLDNDFPFGYPQWADRNRWKLDAEYVKKAAIYLPGIKPDKKPAKTPRTSPIQYWTPPGHNNWVGDVVTFFHQGRYHVFYLFDRRHHGSKFGCGAHYFEHLSTADFKTWTEHEAAAPLDEQWECIGTGTPFVFNNKLCLSYGLHTGRVYPEAKTTWPAQWEYLKKNGRTGEFKRAATPGIPAGATYSVSEDGVGNFKKTWIMFHPCQNPSVYTDPSGELRMLANVGSKGIWESEAVDGGWRCISPDFPPGGDCTFFFRWGKFDYIIGGFTGLWSKPADAPISAYADVVAKGLDFYDGLGVPSITEISGGRFLMAGWLGIRGWGGILAIRELVQFPDGRIGSKWMQEITPETEKPEKLAARIAQEATFPAASQSFMLTFNVEPAEAKKGKFFVSFLGGDGGQRVHELQVDLADQIAHSGRPLKNLIGVDKPFTVRVMVKGDDKLGGTLVDTEIAAARTAIAYHENLAVKKMVFRAEGVELKNVQIAPLKRILIIDPPEKGFFSKRLDYEGIPIKAPRDVADEALFQGRARLAMMLDKLPAVRRRLQKAGAELHIIGRNQGTSDLPEWRHAKGKPFEGKLTIDQRTRGMGGLLTSCGEENLLKLAEDRYRGRDICVHEFAHNIQDWGMTDGVRGKFREQYRRSLAKGLWKGSYAGSNEHEFFAELSMWYWGTHGDLGMEGTKPAVGPEGLRAYDPEACALFDEFYRGKLDADAR